MSFSNDGATWSTPEAYSTSRTWDMAVGGEGVRTVYVKYSDSVGNWSSSYSDTIMYDNIAPGAPTIAFTSPLGYTSGTWTNQSVTFTITNGTDDTSGASYSEYRALLNDGTWTVWGKYTVAMTLSSEGRTMLEARTVDKAGNTGAVASATVNIDRTAPTAPTIQFISPEGCIPGTWINQDATFTITHGSDGTYGSGANKTEYRISLGGEPFGGWMTYSEAVTITVEGITCIEARTIDNLGYTSEMGNAMIGIDKTIPDKPDIKFIAPEEYTPF